MMSKRYTLFYLLMFACALTFAQVVGMKSPVNVQVAQKAVSGHDDLVDIVFTFAISDGWHVYGPDNNGGPTPMTLTMETLEGAKPQGALQLSPTPATVEDPVFGCEVTYVEHSAKATQRLRLTGGSWKAQGYLRYGACNDQECMPPTNVEFEFRGESLSGLGPPSGRPSSPTCRPWTQPPTRSRAHCWASSCWASWAA